MILLFASISPKVIFDFDKTSDIQNWRTVNDVVMGGESSSTFRLNDDGFGVFEGEISLENNGGFSSLRYGFPKIQVKHHTTVHIKLKGDGKHYQFRIKERSETSYSYIAPFSTTGEWQEIEISLADVYPQYRGRKLDKPNFSEDSIAEITFLIGNKKEEKFKLLIDTIVLK
ncbi:MAG: CIA30 family protein [Pricia sp.]